MILKRNKKLNQYLFVIYAGEYFATDEDVIISTVLGSCISVCIYDAINGIGGINHFMLPENVEISEDSRIYTRDTKYGIHAMDMLINSILKKGGVRRNLEAKIFGGASYFGQGNIRRLGVRNIRFAQKYLFLEDIKLISSDVGGSEARKILFYPQTGKVFLKRIFNQNTIQKIDEEERVNMEDQMNVMKKRNQYIDFEDFFLK